MPIKPIANLLICQNTLFLLYFLPLLYHFIKYVYIFCL
nr:MAG TPA: hypothetical protein [Caudoviricetes sp.]